MESSADRLKKVFRKSQKDFMEKKIINEKLEAPRSGEPKSQAVRDLETGFFFLLLFSLFLFLFFSSFLIQSFKAGRILVRESWHNK